jgi:hypothetical protein
VVEPSPPVNPQPTATTPEKPVEKPAVAATTPEKPVEKPAVAATTPEKPVEKPAVVATTPEKPVQPAPKPVQPAPKPVAVQPKPVERHTPVRPVPRAVAAMDKPARPAGNFGFLRINSKPWTKIFVDGMDTNLNTPQTAYQMSPGMHQIMLFNPEFGIRETFSVHIIAGETQTVIKDFRK